MDSGSWRLLTPFPVPWNICFSQYSHSWSHFQGCSLERVRCCWDHLVSIGDWIWLRPLCKLLRFWSASAGWRYTNLEATEDNSLTCQFCYLLNLYLPNQSDLPLSPVSSCPLCTGTSFLLHKEFPESVNQQTSKQNINSWGTEMCPREENKPQETDWGLAMKCCGRHAEQCDFPAGKWVKYFLIYKDDWNLCLKDIWKGKEIHRWKLNKRRLQRSMRDDEELGLQSCIIGAKKE